MLLEQWQELTKTMSTIIENSPLNLSSLQKMKEQKHKLKTALIEFNPQLNQSEYSTILSDLEQTHKIFKKTIIIKFPLLTVSWQNLSYQQCFDIILISIAIMDYDNCAIKLLRADKTINALQIEPLCEIIYNLDTLSSNSSYMLYFFFMLQTSSKLSLTTQQNISSLKLIKRIRKIVDIMVIIAFQASGQLLSTQLQELLETFLCKILALREQKIMGKANSNFFLESIRWKLLSKMLGVTREEYQKSLWMSLIEILDNQGQGKIGQQFLLFGETSTQMMILADIKNWQIEEQNEFSKIFCQPCFSILQSNQLIKEKQIAGVNRVFNWKNNHLSKLTGKISEQIENIAFKQAYSLLVNQRLNTAQKQISIPILMEIITNYLHYPPLQEKILQKEMFSQIRSLFLELIQSSYQNKASISTLSLMLNSFYELITVTICTSVITFEELIKPFFMLIEISNDNPYVLLIISKYLRHLSFFTVPLQLEQKIKAQLEEKLPYLIEKLWLHQNVLLRYLGFYAVEVCLSLNSLVMPSIEQLFAKESLLNKFRSYAYNTILADRNSTEKFNVYENLNNADICKYFNRIKQNESQPLEDLLLKSQTSQKVNQLIASLKEMVRDQIQLIDQQELVSNLNDIINCVSNLKQ